MSDHLSDVISLQAQLSRALARAAYAEERLRLNQNTCEDAMLLCHLHRQETDRVRGHNRLLEVECARLNAHLHPAPPADVPHKKNLSSAGAGGQNNYSSSASPVSTVSPAPSPVVPVP